MEGDALQEPAGLQGSPIQSLDWLEAQGPELQKSHASALLGRQLQAAAQPKSVSGQACTRLCGLMDQLFKARSEELRRWAFSQTVTLQLFNFFLDWNESDHHRSMRLVLDLIVQSVKDNPDGEAASSTKRCLLDSLFAVVTGRSSKPVAKSAIKCLDHFLTKGIFSLHDLYTGYQSTRIGPAHENDDQVWRSFTVDMFHWMRLQFVCPTAGKFIVSVYRGWRRESGYQTQSPSLDEWYQWLLAFASEEPLLLESIKNYIFLPLFKADRDEGLRFLERMNEEREISTACSRDLDTPALLQLAALETGKRIGLVEEPRISDDGGFSAEFRSITIHERMLDGVLTHPSYDVRSLALSLLVTSPSTTRPYSSTALELLQKHMGTFFADSDAKFRVEVSGRLRDMYRRVRGAIHVLKRSVPRARANAAKAKLAGKEVEIDPSSAASLPIQYRSNLISLPEAQLSACLGYHEAFLAWYIGFLCSELIPTASYQRHIASLKALGYILRIEGESSKTWATEDDQRLVFDLFDDKWARALLDLVMDPFEDVREAAASTLQRLYSDTRYRRFTSAVHSSDRDTAAAVAEFSQRAEELARRTSRADHSDGASRATQLLYRLLDTEEQRISLFSNMIAELQRKTSMAEQDLGRAVLDAPLHGDFASLNHVWKVTVDLKLAEAHIEAVQSLQSALVSCCERVWRAVMRVLCDDSPEGMLPQELEDVEGLGTKSLLSFSFRAVHESSNLMRSIVLAARNRSRSGCVSPTRDVFERVGNLTFDQLSTLRHRGAFTTVASTFATCCQQAKYFDHDKPLLEVWYQGTLGCIFSQASTTRRSAGIPSMMTGVLSANAASPSFQHVVEELIGIAGKETRVSETDGSNLPQVHAYNCLKDIFKNSMLTSMGNKSEKYLPQCLELAASGLRSEVWAIRNCGLLLLRSLIDCLFGSQESKAMVEAGWDGKANRIPYHRYPNLPAVLRTLLMSGHEMLAQETATQTAAESVFPTLDIIRRAGPPELLRDEIQVHVAVYLSSPVWHVRELAARTLCSCLLHDGWLSVVEGLFWEALRAHGRNRPNHVHGVLLTFKFLIERLGEVAVEQLTGQLPNLVDFLLENPIPASLRCPDVAAAYLDVINAVWAFEMASSGALSPLKATTPSGTDSVLLRRSAVVHNLHAAAASASPVEASRELLMRPEDDEESLVTALGTMPRLLDASSTSTETLVGLSVLYMDACGETGSSDAQMLATQNLAEVMDELMRRGHSDRLASSSLLEWWSTISSRPMSPALSNAVIGASGGVMAVLSQPQKSQGIDLRAWGHMMSDAGLDDKTIDTRLAAAAALRSFFAVAGTRSSGNDEHLPALVALYDALNDDDDQVRDMGSEAAASITGKALVPLEAGRRLLGWLAQHFGGSASFRAEAAGRVAGRAWEPAADQLDAALRFDDSLFAVEEQNLFVDEVRETERWVRVLQRLPWPEADETLARLDDWLARGLVRLQDLAAGEDGPLGWASDARVFAICSRLVRGSVALVDGRVASRALGEATLRARQALPTHGGRVSRLLTDAWGREELDAQT